LIQSNNDRNIFDEEEGQMSPEQEAVADGELLEVSQYSSLTFG